MIGSKKKYNYNKLLNKQLNLILSLLPKGKLNILELAPYKGGLTERLNKWFNQ